MSESKDNKRTMGSPGRGPGRGVVPGEKARDFKGALIKLLKYMGRYKIGLVFVLLFSICGTVFQIVGPKILGNATTEIFNGLISKLSGTGGIDFDKIARILLLLLSLYLISAAFNFIQGLIMTGISQRIAYRLREDISKKINRMPMKYFESKTVGEVLSRITNDVDTLGMGMNQSVSQLVSAVTTLIGILIMMLSISPLMTIIAFLVLPISGTLIGIVVKASQRHFINQQKFLGEVNGQIEEVFAGQNIVKAFNKEDDIQKDFNETNEKLFHSAFRSQFLSGMMQPIMMFVGNLAYVAVGVVGGILKIRGSIEVGDIQSFIQYVRSFTQPIMQITQVSNMLQSTMAGAERVFEFLEEEEEEVIVENAVKPQHLEGRVAFDHVRFGYDPQKVIIHDFCCEVEAGQTVAIVGPTGAGKTTMVKLLMRFYDVISGKITIDGYDVKAFNRGDLRENFGMVLQDTWLFQGTIMENIRYGRLSATDEEVMEAAKAAHAHRFITTLPGGYQMELNEDASNVSQGQKQLLTIARAILADPRVMILDEATSSVDTRTEARIQKAMNNLMKGRTSFVIAHRLSTIKDADIILVMKDGDIIEQGNHQDLIEKNGFYANLYHSQFEQITA